MRQELGPVADGALHSALFLSLTSITYSTSFASLSAILQKLTSPFAWLHMHCRGCMHLAVLYEHFTTGMGCCRMGQKTPHPHLPLHWMMPQTPQLSQHQPCQLQKMKKIGPLPMASTCPMARVPLTVMASDASMSADQLWVTAALGPGVQSTNRRMIASGASCRPLSLLSSLCWGHRREGAKVLTSGMSLDLRLQMCLQPPSLCCVDCHILCSLHICVASS